MLTVVDTGTERPVEDVREWTLYGLVRLGIGLGTTDVNLLLEGVTNFELEEEGLKLSELIVGLSGPVVEVTALLDGVTDFEGEESPVLMDAVELVNVDVGATTLLDDITACEDVEYPALVDVLVELGAEVESSLDEVDDVFERTEVLVVLDDDVVAGSIEGPYSTMLRFRKEK